MPAVCLYLHAHQPYRLRPFQVFDIGQNSEYFDDLENKQILERVVHKSYLPANEKFYYLIKDTKGRFKINFSISGVLLDQLEQFFPEVIESFQKLARSGAVNFIPETSHHSLAVLFCEDEFLDQVEQQEAKLRELFGESVVKVFRNTELLYSDRLATLLFRRGYRAVLAEGTPKILNDQSPNFLYQSVHKPIKIFLRNYQLSDDISFRFSERSWKQWPLTADKFASWINSHNGNGEIINLFMDYETFGEHQWPETGIFEFLEALPDEVLKHPDNNFVTTQEAVERLPARGVLSSPEWITWADTERDVSAWLDNNLQKISINELYRLKQAIKSSKDGKLLDDWRKLQISDHFYHMCTKWSADGDVHKYFNPYDSPYDAFVYFNNILQDLKHRLNL